MGLFGELLKVGVALAVAAMAPETLRKMSRRELEKHAAEGNELAERELERRRGERDGIWEGGGGGGDDDDGDGDGGTESEVDEEEEDAVATEQVETGSFVDKRDGQVYRTVKMPDGKVWMAQNLNYKIEDSVCYGDDEAIGEKYGRLYTWDAALKACPVGWHLPSQKEWNGLLESVGGRAVAGKVLKSRSGWKKNNGRNSYGFSALPGGSQTFDGVFERAGLLGYWWVATEQGEWYAIYKWMEIAGDEVGEYYIMKDMRFSVRCVKD